MSAGHGREFSERAAVASRPASRAWSTPATGGADNDGRRRAGAEGSVFPKPKEKVSVRRDGGGDPPGVENDWLVPLTLIRIRERFFHAASVPELTPGALLAIRPMPPTSSWTWQPNTICVTGG